MPIDLTDEIFENFPDEQDIIMDFSATWCGPCKRMKPDFLSAESFIINNTNIDLKFAVIDVDEAVDLAETFEITCMPTIILRKKGKIVYRNEGAMNYDQLMDVIANHYDIKKNNQTSKNQQSLKLL